MNRNYLIVIGLGVATIIAFLLINYFTGAEPTNENIEVELENYLQEIEELEGSILEMEVISEIQIQELSNMKNLLDEKYTELAFLENKVDELEKKGQASDVTIQNLRAQLAEAKGRVAESQMKILQTELNVVVEDYSSLTRMMDSVLLSSENSDSLLFAAQRAQRLAEVALQDCQEAKGIDPVSVPQKAQMRADNFLFRSMEPGTTKEKDSSPRRLDRIGLEKLGVCFELSGNELEPTGLKNLYLIMKRPDGTIYKTQRSQSIQVSGTAMLYTSDAKVEYQKAKSSNNVCVEFQPGEGMKFEGGRNLVQIVYNGEVIGQKRLFIKP